MLRTVNSRNVFSALILFFFVLDSASMAQTTLYGSNTKVVGSAATLINPANTFTKIYVVFPPQGGSNNTNFVTSVMTQSAIDGVTLAVPWNAVELTTSPSTTPCAAVGTDTCQLDPLTSPPNYHTYGWSTVDGTGCGDTNTNSTSQWFCNFPNGSGPYKHVNIQLFGISAGSVNNGTPTYITSPTWLSATGVTNQDAVNYINTSGCSTYTGNSVPGSSTWDGDGTGPPSKITVAGWTHGFTNGDTLWVNGLDSHFNYTGQYGATIYVDSTTQFHYYANGVTGTHYSGLGVTAVSAIQSWLVPYEAPYAAGWLSFLKAAIYHYNHLNNVSGNMRQTLAQIGYIRPGVARGGEAIPICTGSLPMTGFTESLWIDQTTSTVGWYTQVVNTVQAANPQMQIMYSINSGDPASPNADYSTREAKVVVAHSNSVGMFDGFGSQGLAQADTGFASSNCPDDNSTPDTGNNWGCMFDKYWSGSTAVGSMAASPTTVPLELQQIDCSNPTAYSSSYSNSCFQGGVPGKTGNFGTLFPFITGSATQGSQHVSIIELYNQDALLAYDTKYCDPDNSGLVCKSTSGFDTFTDLSSDTTYNFYVNVGQGSSCSGSSCYSTIINQAHGYH